jgi:hypothetical protein
MRRNIETGLFKKFVGCSGGLVCVDWPYLGIYEHINELQVPCRWSIYGVTK